MIDTKINSARGKILEEIAKALDISPTQMKLAKEKYLAVGKWLGKEGSPLEDYDLVIYPQGSFLLGTVVKPILDDDEYDIDLVCLLLAATDDKLTQEQLKNLIGNRLKDNSDYERMLEDEKRRCWTLKYSDDTKFHLDILPCIPDPLFSIIYPSVPKNISEHSIKLTDNLSEFYEKISTKWNKGNPKGYFEWFKNRMIERFTLIKEEYAKIKGLQIDEVEDFEIRTPLQRVIQILKRHRDIKYGSDDDKPISIIITTLAAKAYNGEDNIYEALENILNNMENYIEVKYSSGSPVVWIKNPVNPDENFADKWEDEPNKKRVFVKWLNEAKTQILGAFQKEGTHNILNDLKKHLGEKTIITAANRLGMEMTEKRNLGNLMFDSSSGKLGLLGSQKVHNHRFYGER